MCVWRGGTHIFTYIYISIPIIISASLCLEPLMLWFDVDVMTTVIGYITEVATCVKKATMIASTLQDVGEGQEELRATPLPRVKFVADVCSLCVAIVQTSSVTEPKMLQLKVLQILGEQLLGLTVHVFVHVVHNYSALNEDTCWCVLLICIMKTLISLHGYSQRWVIS